MLVLLCLAAVSAITTLAEGGAVHPNTVIPQKVHTDHDGTLCPYEADVALLLDASTSIGSKDYQNIQEFLINVVDNFDIGPDNVRVSAITFKDNVKVEYYLTNFTTKSQVKAAFGDFQRDGERWGTLTHRALKFARTKLFTPEAGDRPDVPNIVILVTDGRSSNKTKTLLEQRLLKDTGALVFAIGIGYIDDEEMRAVASSPAETFYQHVKDTDGLQKILEKFNHDACAAMTTTPPVCPHGADVMILMDASSSIGKVDFEKMKRFLIREVEHFDIDHDKVRVGLITYNIDVNFVFHLDEYLTKQEVLGAFKPLRGIRYGTLTHRALKFARQIGFTAENGDRSDKPNVAIIITDGRSSNPDKTALEAQALRDSGVTVFAIGIGWTSRTELRTIAGSEKNCFYVKNFDGLQDILDSFQGASCQGIARAALERP